MHDIILTQECRSVPWSSWEEWNYVRQLIQSREEEDIQAGLEWLATWRSRGKVPHAVEATDQLLQCQLPLGVAHPAMVQQYRLGMAMAITRFVNGFVDKAQKRSSAVSISSLGKRIGLPRWVVDLRHESTHSHLPTPEVLSMARNTCLQWLLQRYWAAQAAQLVEMYSASPLQRHLKDFHVNRVAFRRTFKRSLRESRFVRPELPRPPLFHKHLTPLLSAVTANVVAAASLLPALLLDEGPQGFLGRLGLAAEAEALQAPPLPFAAAVAHDSPTSLLPPSHVVEGNALGLHRLRGYMVPVLYYLQCRHPGLLPRLFWEIAARIMDLPAPPTAAAQGSGSRSQRELLLFSWIKFFLSRQWHSLWFRSLSLMPGDGSETKQLRDAQQ